MNDATHTVEVEHVFAGPRGDWCSRCHQACLSIDRWFPVRSGPPSGPAWVPLWSRPGGAAEAYNLLHDQHEGSCPLRAIGPGGEVLTRETMPKPVVGLVITPSPDGSAYGMRKDTTWHLLPGVGYWVGKHSMSFPDPRDFIDLTKTDEERRKLVDYLEAGAEVARWCGNSFCRFCGVSNGGYTLSDGRFAWPCGLSHYVWHHGVWIPGLLPEEGATS